MTAALATPVCAIEPIDDEAEEQLLAEELKSEEDPTILTSYVSADVEWNNDRNDANSLEITLAGRKAWHVSDRQDWAVQLELPYNRTDTGEAGSQRINQGLGDMTATVGTAVRLSETARIGGGLELRMPTGEDEISANIWRLAEILVVAWDAAPWLTLSPRAKYFQAIAKQHGASSQHYLELRLPATFTLPNYWSVTPRYELKLDFENDLATHTGKLSINKELEHPNLGLGLSIEVPFDRQTNQFTVNFGITAYF